MNDARPANEQTEASTSFHEFARQQGVNHTPFDIMRAGATAIEKMADAALDHLSALKPDDVMPTPDEFELARKLAMFTEEVDQMTRELHNYLARTIRESGKKLLERDEVRAPASIMARTRAAVEASKAYEHMNKDFESAMRMSSMEMPTREKQ